MSSAAAVFLAKDTGESFLLEAESDRPISLRVNGEPHEVAAPPSRTLLDVLREDLDLTGAKKACDNGECGSCIVLLGRKPAKACLLAAQRAAGKEVTTIEGLAPAAADVETADDLSALHPLQQRTDHLSQVFPPERLIRPDLRE